MDGVLRAAHVNVWAPKSFDGRIVCFLSDRSEIVFQAVHWVKPERSSFPCSEDENCQWHHYPLNNKAYCPVLISKVNYPHPPDHRPHALAEGTGVTGWQLAILEVTQGHPEVVEAAEPGLVVHVCRPSKEGSNRVFYKQLTWRLPFQVHLNSFNVRANIDRMWQAVWGKKFGHLPSGSGDVGGDTDSPLPVLPFKKEA